MIKKIMTNRWTVFAPIVISPNQFGFIKRRIIDCVCLVSIHCFVGNKITKIDLK